MLLILHVFVNPFHFVTTARAPVVIIGMELVFRK